MPRRRVIGTMTPCHSPNHIPPAESLHRNAPRLLDRSRPTAGGRTGIAPPVMPGATPRKPAVWRRNGRSCVTPVAGVAPGEFFPPGRVSALQFLRSPTAPAKRLRVRIWRSDLSSVRLGWRSRAGSRCRSATHRRFATRVCRVSGSRLGTRIDQLLEKRLVSFEYRCRIANRRVVWTESALRPDTQLGHVRPECLPLVSRLASSMQNSSPFRPRENAIDPGKV